MAPAPLVTCNGEETSHATTGPCSGGLPAYAPYVSAGDPTVQSGTSTKTGAGTFSCLVSNAASTETTPSAKPWFCPTAGYSPV